MDAATETLVKELHEQLENNKVTISELESEISVLKLQVVKFMADALTV